MIRTYVFSMWAGIRNLSELCVVYFAELNNLARDADFWVAVQKSPRLPDFCTGQTQIGTMGRKSYAKRAGLRKALPTVGLHHASTPQRRSLRRYSFALSLCLRLK